MARVPTKPRPRAVPTTRRPHPRGGGGSHLKKPRTASEPPDPPDGDALLLEDGASYLLLEDGASRLLLE